MKPKIPTPIFLFFLLLTGVISDDFTSNWMGQIHTLIQNQTLLDLTLPGTHDTMTYDLSTVVSEGGDDDSEAISYILHYASELGIAPGDWIRNQSKTQGLDVVSQLNYGVRFLDFRIMYTSDDWYCLHFMQSNQKSITYLQQIRQWLDSHPLEIITIWLSKHGSTCATGNDQYPDVPNSSKLAFWAQIQQVFSGLLIDTRQSPVNTTSISDLIARKHRVIIYASDYQQFTNGSPFALDGCNIDNTLCSGVSDEPGANKCLVKVYQDAFNTRKKDKEANRFFLLSMATSGPGEQLELLFMITYVPIDKDSNTKKCAQIFSIPNMTDWCPPHLQDISQLTNYYNQIPLEAAITNNWEFPNAIYLDALDLDGTIRTGTQLFPNGEGGGFGDHEMSRYPYVDTLVLVNVRRACGVNKEGDCGRLENILEMRRAKYPVQYWSDVYGRNVNWP